MPIWAENEQEENENADTALVNRLTSGTDTNPEALLIDKENVADIEAAIEKELSSFEKQVLDLYLTGMTYSQIAKVLGRDEKSADNALQRLKGKIRRAMHKSHMMIAVGLICLLWPLQAFAEQEMTRVSVESSPQWKYHSRMTVISYNRKLQRTIRIYRKQAETGIR